ncbi:MAG: hypothetical protein KJ850_01130 [Gammaproteobacteria bacterium]|nr:hypothetical protein [Gammaproteobacteria bacterium]MBU1623626.1 hypothetical protein [Gammaproteobacteria bacterium]
MTLNLRYFLFSALAALAFGTAQAQEEAAHAEFVYEFDPYYTNAGYNIPLTDKPIPTIESGSEAVIYRELIKDSFIPRYMTLEASLYPMPIMGTWLKTHHRGFYDSAAIGKNFNIIESLTAGFQEPWAVSLFFGNVAKLKRPGEKRIGNNYGYTGYLFSMGEKHIKNNLMVEDHWFELEWKIKGQLDYTDKKLSWSFRGGAKFHNNVEVNDVYYVALSRSNTELHSPGLDWLDNTTADFRVHFLQQSGKLVRAELIVGKKLPLPEKDYTPTLSAGFIWTSPYEYAGSLRSITDDTLTFVIRPSIEF